MAIDSRCWLKLVLESEKMEKSVVNRYLWSCEVQILFVLEDAADRCTSVELCRVRSLSGASRNPVMGPENQSSPHTVMHGGRGPHAGLNRS